MESALPESLQRNWKSPFFTIWSGQAVSIVGSNLAQFALIWWLTTSTGSATVLAGATLVGMLPQIVLGPIAGTLVDRWNRQLVMMIADSLIAAFSLVLALLFAAGGAKVWHVLVIMLLRSMGSAFHWPAMQASTSLMVPKDQLSRVAGMNKTLYGVMNIGAPPMGAFLLEVMPISSILMIDVVTAVMAVLPLFWIMVPQPTRRVAPKGIGSKVPARTTVWQDFRAGLKYVASWPGLTILLILASVLNFLLNPAFALLPLLVKQHFHGEAMHLGLLDSVYGVGLIVGGIILSTWGGFRKRIVTSMFGLVGMGLGITLVGFAPANLFVMAVIGLALDGLMNPICNGPIDAILQASVEPQMQGRVITLVSSAAGLMSPVSLAVAGPVSDVVGIQTWFSVAGVLMVILALVCLLIPPMIHIEDGRGAVST